MKIDRLIGIITTLQQKKTVTAPYLAEKFEVSRRTINRDIEDICKAGIPIVTTQGVNGGISIMDGFSLDTTVFTEQELAAIFTGLKSLDSVSNSASAEKLAQKIGGSSAIRLADNMVIDLILASILILSFRLGIPTLALLDSGSLRSIAMFRIAGILHQKLTRDIWAFTVERVPICFYTTTATASLLIFTSGAV